LRPGNAFLIQSTRKARVTRHLFPRAFNARAHYYAPACLRSDLIDPFSLSRSETMRRKIR
jgi:hypothetical protein